MQPRPPNHQSRASGPRQQTQPFSGFELPSRLGSWQEDTTSQHDIPTPYLAEDPYASSRRAILDPSKDIPKAEYEAILRDSVIDVISKDHQTLQLLQIIKTSYPTIDKEFPELLKRYASRLSAHSVIGLSRDISVLVRSEREALSAAILLQVAPSTSYRNTLEPTHHESQTRIAGSKGKGKEAAQNAQRNHSEIRQRAEDLLHQGTAIETLRQDLARLSRLSMRGSKVPKHSQTEYSQSYIMEAEDIPCRQANVVLVISKLTLRTVYLETLPSLIDYIIGRFSILLLEPPISDGLLRARWICVSFG